MSWSTHVGEQLEPRTRVELMEDVANADRLGHRWVSGRRRRAVYKDDVS